MKKLRNYYVRQYLLALRDILGEEDFGALARESSLARYPDGLPPADDGRDISPREFSDLLFAVRRRYGERGGEILRNAGHKTFRRNLEAYDWAANLVRMVTGVLKSPEARVLSALKRAAGVVEMETGVVPKIREQGGAFFWENAECPFCAGITSGEACCDLAAGVLEALVAWTLDIPQDAVSVTEEECRAAGGQACRYRIEIKPSRQNR